MMRDFETGYIEECECCPCTDCGGEGGGTAYCNPGCRKGGWGMQASCSGHDWECSTCHGTGTLADDCPIHGCHEPDPVELGALALGAEWEHEPEPEQIPRIGVHVRIPRIPSRRTA